MNLIDFHVHIDYFKDYYDKFNYYNKNKIYTLFVTNLPEIYERCIKSFKESKYVKIALGYNPQFAGSDNFNRYLFDKYFDSTKYIGEVGLDFSKEYIIYKEKQIEALKYVSEKSGRYNKILSVHSRNAEEEVIDILANNGVKFAVFHWYTGKIETLRKIVNLGYYFSVNNKMLETKNGLNIIKNIPLDRILIETDGPFIPYSRKLFSPEKLPEIYSCFAQNLGTVNFDKVVFNNLKSLLLKQEQSFK